MVSMLTRCPQCGVSHAKDSQCPDCGWSELGEAGLEQEERTVNEFGERLRIHRRNYAAYMVLMFATGLFGLITSYMWLRLIFMGDVIALAIIGISTVLTAGLTGLLVFAEKFFPTHLNCPTCEIELDSIGFDSNRCPGCNSLLR